MPHSAAAGRLAALVVTLRAVPSWAWLVVLVTASALIRFWLGRGTLAPWIMIDELIYSELAKSFASSGDFLVRGQPSDVFGFVYPMLISPAWAVFDAVPRAYAAAKAINAVVMSLAAVPAYFLARRVLAPSWSLVAALLTVAVPSMVYTAALMTENAFYPLFVAAALAAVLWLERPTALRTFIVLAVFLVAFLTRAQAIAILPALLTAPLLIEGRAAIRRYALMYGLATVGALGVIVVQTARGASLLGIFGAYDVAGEAHYTVHDVSKWFVYHLAELDLALGVIPFAALLMLALAWRRLARRDRILVAATLSLSFWLVLEVAIFASEQTFRIEERNMFYVAPLFLIAMLAWIERGLPRPQPAVTVAAAVAASLPVVIPYENLIGLNAVSDTAALLPLGWLVERGLALSDVDLVVLAGCVVAALAFLFVPRRYAIALPALVLVYYAVSQHPIIAEQRFPSHQLFGGITAHRDWIDRAVGRNADVSVIWTGMSDKFTVWEDEFFNRSVGTVYTTGPELPGGLPRTSLTVDRRTGYLHGPDGKRIDAEYVLTDTSFEPKGRLVAQDQRTGMVLYRFDGPLRQLAFVTGLYPEDTWSRKRVTYVRHACHGGTLDVDLQSDPALYTGRNGVVARVGGRVVARARLWPTETTKLSVPLESVGNTCTVHFTVDRTAVPEVVTGGANLDPRRLGLHFNRFEYRP
jgi:hypothetical protein